MLLTYHAGIVDFIQDHFETENAKVIGASAGVFATMALITGIPARVCMKAWLETIYPYYGKRFFGVYFDKDAKTLKANWNKWLPDNIVELTKDRLILVGSKISKSFPFFEKLEMKNFQSKQELIDACVCTQSIPFILFRCLTYFRNNIVLDGGFTCNSPVIDENTVIVTAFPSFESDISPKNIPSNLFTFDNLEDGKKTAEKAYQDAEEFGIENWLKRGWKLKKNNSQQKMGNLFSKEKEINNSHKL